MTNSFIQFADAENTGSMSDAIRRATRLRKQPQVLVSTINDRAVLDVTREYDDEELSARYYAQLNHDNQCELLGASPTPLAARKYVCELRAALERFVKACDLTLGELNDAAQYNYWPDGGARNGWVQHLIHILKAHDLPTGARKDAASKTSPFVAFVNALQACIPREYARARHSMGALADAIHKARHAKIPSVELRNVRRRKSGLNANA